MTFWQPSYLIWGTDSTDSRPGRTPHITVPAKSYLNPHGLLIQYIFERIACTWNSLKHLQPLSIYVFPAYFPFKVQSYFLMSAGKQVDMKHWEIAQSGWQTVSCRWVYKTKEAMPCLRLPLIVTSPASWVRIARGKEWMTPKVLEKCQNTELRINHVYLWFRLNAMKIRKIYSPPKGSAEQGHHSRKAQNS